MLTSGSSQWLKKLCDYFFQKANFQQLQSKSAIFIKSVGSAFAFILSYVDSLKVLSSTSIILKATNDEFFNYFERSAEPLKWYLEVYFKFFAGSIQILQSNIILLTFAELHILDLKPSLHLWLQIVMTKGYFI